MWTIITKGVYTATSRSGNVFGLLKPFWRKQDNTMDVSNKHDWSSLGARLQGGKQVVKADKKYLLKSHNIDALLH